MKHSTKLLICFLLACSLMLTPVGMANAAPAPQTQILVSGMVESITLETNSATGITTVSITVLDNDQMLQSVRVTLETGIAMGLVVLNGDGKPEINPVALGKPVEIDSSIVLLEQQNQHPVGSALATFFSGVEGIDYEAVMSAHEQGVGFGIIAQMLWLTTKMDGDAEIFTELITAKQTGDYSAFVLEDGSIPQNWGQLRKAILDGDKNGGIGISQKDNNDNNANDPANEDKDKEDNGNNGNKDKDKDKDKDKEKKK